MRNYARLIPLALFLAIAACSAITDPTPKRAPSLRPGNALHDDITPPDTNCRNGWNTAEGRAC